MTDDNWWSSLWTEIASNDHPYYQLAVIFLAMTASSLLLYKALAYLASGSGKTQKAPSSPSLFSSISPEDVKGIAAQTISEMQYLRDDVDLFDRGWKLSDVLNGVRVWAKQAAASSSAREELLLCSGVVEAPAPIVFEALWDLRQRREWEAHLTGHVVSTFDTQTDIVGMDRAGESETAYFSRHYSVVADGSCWVVEASTLHPSLRVCYAVQTLKKPASLPDAALPAFETHTSRCLLHIVSSFPKRGVVGRWTSALPRASRAEVATAKFSGLREYASTRFSVFSSRGLIATYPPTAAKERPSAAEAPSPSVARSSKRSGKRVAQGKTLPAERPPVADIAALLANPQGEGVTIKLPINTRYEPAHAYRKECVEVMQGVLEAEAGTERDGWQLEFTKKEIDVMKRTIPGSSAVCVKGTGRIDAPPRAVFDLVLDITKRKMYDTMFKTGHVVDELNDPFCKVVYLEYEALWPTAARDFCVVIFLKILDDNSCVLAARSVVHPRCPEVKGYVRADAQVTGWVIRSIPDEPMACMGTYITQVDLKGNVPSMIVSKVTTEQPLCIDSVRKAVKTLKSLEKYVPVPPVPVYPAPVDDSDSGSGDHDNDGNVDHDGSYSDGLEDTENLSTAVAGNETMHQTAASSPSSVHRASISSASSSSSFVQASYDVICSQSLGEVLKETMYTCDVSPIDDASASSGSLEGTGWRMVSVEKDVVILKKVIVGSSIHRFMGKGIIRCPAPIIYNAVKDGRTRSVYDNMLKEVTIIQQVDSETQVIHMTHETTQCLMKHSRDFCVLVRGRKEATGKYLVGGVSIAHPRCPAQESVVRGEVLASGWYIEPLPDGSSMVTYVTQVDLKGGVPSRVLNVISVKQPLCIAYLRKSLEKKDRA